MNSQWTPERAWYNFVAQSTLKQSSVSFNVKVCFLLNISKHCSDFCVICQQYKNITTIGKLSRKFTLYQNNSLKCLKNTYFRNYWPCLHSVWSKSNLAGLDRFATMRCSIYAIHVQFGLLATKYNAAGFAHVWGIHKLR